MNESHYQLINVLLQNLNVNTKTLFYHLKLIGKIDTKQVNEQQIRRTFTGVNFSLLEKNR